MNERIRQLAKQAGFVLWKDESWNPGDVIDWSCRYDDEFKKFAQLIVGECAEIAKHNVMNISTYADAEFVDQQIKQHFGVEQ